ncbi:ABC transporter permease [Candidatus Bipolaricaulota bacterium]|nr:ABC transporter permease [Candidatus Bipolaricaulota bacterium]
MKPETVPSSSFRRLFRSLLWVLSLLIFLLLWQGITSLFNLPTWLLPSPIVTLSAVINDAPLLAHHLTATALAAAWGLGLAILLGLTLAMLMNGSKVFSDLIYPHLILLQAVPLIAVAPIIIIWFGLDLLSKVVIVAFICTFPICVSTYEGFRTVDSGFRELLDTFHASRWQRYRHLHIPATLPGIFAGLKIAATYSVMGAVIGEWLGGSRGIGIYMVRALQSFRTDRLFAAIVIVMVMSFAIFKGVDLLGAYLAPWSKRRHDE